MAKPLWTDEDVAQVVRRSTAAQGLPEKITDPVFLDKVVTLAGLDQPAPAAAAPAEGEVA
jgi:hypothetical protein